MTNGQIELPVFISPIMTDNSALIMADNSALIVDDLHLSPSWSLLG